jgi:hypothetical protein
MSLIWLPGNIPAFKAGLGRIAGISTLHKQKSLLKMAEKASISYNQMVSLALLGSQICQESRFNPCKTKKLLASESFLISILVEVVCLTKI